MDRGEKWALNDRAYNAITKAEGAASPSAEAAINDAYANLKNPNGQPMVDEYIPPTVIGDYKGVQDGDSVIHFNFRQDRAIELTKAFVEDNYPGDRWKKMDVVYCGLPDRDRVFTLAYTNREASYLKRFTFGGTILNKLYHCIPPKSKVLFFEPDTPAELFIKYKSAPYQKINQQTCNPAEVEVKGPKTRGRQISIKDISTVNSKPPRGWDTDAPSSRVVFS